MINEIRRKICGWGSKESRRAYEFFLKIISCGDDFCKYGGSAIAGCWLVVSIIRWMKVCSRGLMPLDSAGSSTPSVETLDPESTDVLPQTPTPPHQRELLIEPVSVTHFASRVHVYETCATDIDTMKRKREREMVKRNSMQTRGLIYPALSYERSQVCYTLCLPTITILLFSFNFYK